MEWILDGIGTEIISFILGSITGVIGYKGFLKHKNKQIQKAGDKSVQIQNDGNNEGNISVDKISGDKNSPKGDYVGGNKIISNNLDEFDIRNFSHYSNSQIEQVINKGNNATRRQWCLELIINQRQDYIIKQSIEKMDNNSEKYKLLVELANRRFDDSDYFKIISDSLTNGVYQVKTIKLFIQLNREMDIERLFRHIANDKYIFEGLICIYNYNHNLFQELYKNGKCFNDIEYMRKMENWLKEQEEIIK